MKTIYAVSCGSYSDYSVRALFSTKDKAQNYIDSFKSTTYGGFNEIEEYTLDEITPKKGYKAFEVVMCRDGYVQQCTHEDSDYGFTATFLKNGIVKFHNEEDLKLRLYLFAKDRIHAIKIANEKRAELIAMDRWVENK